MKHPFPFIGAGYGQYFEWCEIHLLFKDVPNKDAKKRIIDAAPPPIKPTEDDFENNFLIACSEQFVNHYIQRNYGIEIDNTEEFSEYECSEEASDKFEEDINRWLLEVNTICPILVVYRPEDYEAGGTELSNWHDKSATLLKPIIESWIESDAISNESIQYIALNAIYYYFMEDPLILKFIERSLPPLLFLDLLGDVEHKKLLQTKEAEQGLLKTLSNTDFDHTPFGSEVILHAIRTKSSKLKTKLHEVIQTQSIENIHQINYHWYSNHLKGNTFPKIVLEGYWMLMDALETSGIELTDLSVYNNIMVACLKESHNGVGKERARKAIVIGKKYAAKNPLMYWSTFTLQCELNLLDEALISVKEYFKNNDTNKDFLTGELKKNEEYKAFRETPKGSAFIKEL